MWPCVWRSLSHSQSPQPGGNHFKGGQVNRGELTPPSIHPTLFFFSCFFYLLPSFIVPLVPSSLLMPCQFSLTAPKCGGLSLILDNIFPLLEVKNRPNNFQVKIKVSLAQWSSLSCFEAAWNVRVQRLNLSTCKHSLFVIFSWHLDFMFQKIKPKKIYIFLKSKKKNAIKLCFILKK